MSEKEIQQDNQPVVAPKEAKATQEAKTASCPVCGKPAGAAHDPFCSARCADVDLNRWLTGTYAIPGRPVEDEEESY